MWGRWRTQQIIWTLWCCLTLSQAIIASYAVGRAFVSVLKLRWKRWAFAWINFVSDLWPASDQAPPYVWHAKNQNVNNVTYNVTLTVQRYVIVVRFWAWLSVNMIPPPWLCVPRCGWISYFQEVSSLIETSESIASASHPTERFELAVQSIVACLSDYTPEARFRAAYANRRRIKFEPLKLYALSIATCIP